MAYKFRFFFVPPKKLHSIEEFFKTDQSFKGKFLRLRQRVLLAVFIPKRQTKSNANYYKNVYRITRTVLRLATTNVQLTEFKMLSNSQIFQMMCLDIVREYPPCGYQ